MNRLLQILLWSVIAAAFVGPGTVTTCARAGVEHRYALLWAVAFSTIACLVLQEASARITVVSGSSLGQALRRRFHGGLTGWLVLSLVLGAIVVGCAAYQAGNVLGAAAGASLARPVRPGVVSLVVTAVAGTLLWGARTRTVARAMGLIVAVMGVAFLVTAALLRPAPLGVARGLLVPAVPEGAGLLVVGLVGTTVVPYNLFLGSGLARGQELRELRFGLAVAILLGGVISAGIVVVGAATVGPFGFEALADALGERLGGPGRWTLAVGLFSAGLSSAITAPLAAAVTARGLFDSADAPRWDERSWRYRAVWLVVLLTGVAFAVAAVRPIEVIVLAQALNGILLPFVAIFLLLMVNDRGLMGARRINSARANAVMALVVAVTLVLGLANVLRAAATALGRESPTEGTLLGGAALLTALLAVPVGRAVGRRRRSAGRGGSGYCT